MPEVVIGCSLEERSLSVYGLLQDTELQCLLDGGAERNVLAERCWDKLPTDTRPPLQPVDVHLKTVMGDSIPVSGRVRLPLKLGKTVIPLEFIVGDIPEECILGMPFNNKARVVLDYDDRILYMKGTREKIQCYSNRQKPVVASVRIARTVVVEPGEEYVVPGRVHYRGLTRRMNIVEGSSRFSRQHQVLVARSLVDVEHTHDRVPVRVFNPGAEPVEIEQGSFVGCLQPAMEVCEGHDDQDDDHIYVSSIV